MPPPVAAVIEAHRTLEGLVAGLSDQQVAEASALPGWSRGHVRAHLADNARMFARLTDHALRGELVAGYDGGDEHAEDVGRHWSVGDGPPGVAVTGRVRDLAAWLAGRTPAVSPVVAAVSPVVAAELPVLGPWPPHPRRERAR